MFLFSFFSLSPLRCPPWSLRFIITLFLRSILCTPSLFLSLSSFTFSPPSFNSPHLLPCFTIFLLVILFIFSLLSSNLSPWLESFAFHPSLVLCKQFVGPVLKLFVSYVTSSCATNWHSGIMNVHSTPLSIRLLFPSPLNKQRGGSGFITWQLQGKSRHAALSNWGQKPCPRTQWQEGGYNQQPPCWH